MQLAVGVFEDRAAGVAAGEAAGSLRLEALLPAIRSCFEHVLCLDNVASGEDFFELGGDSASAVELALEIESATGVALPMTAVFDAPTAAEMVRLVQSYQGRTAGDPVVLKQGTGSGKLFLFPGAGGTAAGLRPFARSLTTGMTVYGFDTPGLNGKEAPLDRIEAMAAHFLPHLRAVQPHGPYYLAGYSIGGLVAFEVAQRLRAQGEAVALVGLIDTSIARAHYGWKALTRIWARRARDHLRRARHLPPLSALRYAARHVRSVAFDIVPPHAKVVRPVSSVSDAGAEASRRYWPRRYDGPAVLLWSEAAAEFNSLDLAWRSRARHLVVHRLPGDHYSAMTTDVAFTAAAFSTTLSGQVPDA